MVLPTEAFLPLTYTFVQLGLYPLVIWLMLEVRDLGKKQKKQLRTNTTVVKALLKKGIIEPDDISGVYLDGE